MTNLYDFLRSLLDQADNQDKSQCGPMPTTVTREDLDWLRQYMRAPDHQIHFKARKVGEENGEPVYAQDYAIAGNAVDIFSLLTEAMMQNASFAQVVGCAYRFFVDHVPTCPDCQASMADADPHFANWKFSPHKNK